MMLSGKFIKATETCCTYEKPVPAPYLRRGFQLDRLPEAMTVTLTCTGFYRLWVNGTEITQGRLAPMISNPDEMLFYDTYSLLPYLQEGENCLGLLLGNGFSNAIGGFVWAFDRAPFRSAPLLALAAEIRQGGTERLLFEADEQFLCAPSPVLFDDLRSGEHYDAGSEQTGWNLPDWNDRSWTHAIPAQPPRGKAVRNDADRVVLTGEIAADRMICGRIAETEYPERIRPDAVALEKTAFYQPDGQETGYIYCFPENRAFVPRLRIRGRRGQRIVLQTAEFCTPDGVISFENHAKFYPCGFCQRDVYICRGEGVEEYIPSFTYHGGRYVMVIGADAEQLLPDTVTMLTLNTDLVERGNFSCSSAVINRLQKNVRNSDLSNFVWFPTDCPHREKNGWTGDAAMSCEHMLQNLSVERNLHQWLRMICAAQRADGALPGIVPTSGWGFAWGNGPVWDQVLVELPYQIYLYRGDIGPFRECAPSILRYLYYLSGKRDAHGLIHFGLGDWCHALRSPEDNYLCPTEVSDTITAYSICHRAAFLYGVTGDMPGQHFAGELAEELRRDIRNRLIDPDTMTVRGTCQTAQAMGLYYGIFEAGERPAAYQRLLQLVHASGDRIDFGMIGARVVFRTLADFGNAELACRMIAGPGIPSYGALVEQFGLTSMPESFEWKVDGVRTSLNHHFLSDISGFFIRYLAGIQVNPYRDDPGFVRVRPAIVPQLTFAEAYYDTVAGRIRARWEREGDTAKLWIQKASAVHGELIIPDSWLPIFGNGMPDSKILGRHCIPLASDSVQVTLCNV